MPKLSIINQHEIHTHQVEVGTNLRQTLLQLGYTPYTNLTQKLNCGGRGICATCGVWIETPAPAPQHWHDKLAHNFGYPRLSCQITINDDMTIHILDDKIIWGGRNST